MYYTYILRCIDGTFYCGYTDDVGKRFEKHKAGKGAKYTRAHPPVEIAYCETYETKSEAMSREWHIKKMTHEQKVRLIASKKAAMKDMSDFEK